MFDNAKRAPSDYKCAKCGMVGVKLWRRYQTFDIELWCAKCACKHYKKDISTMAPDGSMPSGLFEGHRGWEIEWYIPAMPDSDQTGYWSYTSIPTIDFNWWKALPNVAPVNNGAP